MSHILTIITCARNEEKNISKVIEFVQNQSFKNWRYTNFMDPEIPVNLYDLGLIYLIKNTNNNIVIEMTLTNPNCPVAGQMPENVGKSIEQLYGIKSIEVKLVWKPIWSKDLMSEDAKLALDIF